jgi:hypothetical protein
MGMRQIPECLAQPFSVLSLVFLKLVVLAPHQHQVNSRQSNILTIFMGIIFLPSLELPLCIFLPNKHMSTS